MKDQNIFYFRNYIQLYNTEVSAVCNIGIMQLQYNIIFNFVRCLVNKQIKEAHLMNGWQDVPT